MAQVKGAQASETARDEASHEQKLAAKRQVTLAPKTRGLLDRPLRLQKTDQTTSLGH